MKCLYCGQRLALLRKLTDSEFCSAAHRRQYHRDQEQLALARLVDAQKRFSVVTGLNTEVARTAAPPAAGAVRTARPPAAEAINGFVGAMVKPVSGAIAVRKPAADPLAQNPERHLPGGAVVLDGPRVRLAGMTPLNVPIANVDQWRERAVLRMRAPFYEPVTPASSLGLIARLAEAGRVSFLLEPQAAPLSARPEAHGPLPALSGLVARPTLPELALWSAGLSRPGLLALPARPHPYFGCRPCPVGAAPVPFAGEVAVPAGLAAIATISIELTGQYAREAREVMLAMLSEPQASLAGPAAAPDPAPLALPALARTVDPAPVDEAPGAPACAGVRFGSPVVPILGTGHVSWAPERSEAAPEPGPVECRVEAKGFPAGLEPIEPAAGIPSAPRGNALTGIAPALAFHMEASLEATEPPGPKCGREAGVRGDPRPIWPADRSPDATVRDAAALARLAVAIAESTAGLPASGRCFPLEPTPPVRAASSRSSTPHWTMPPLAEPAMPALEARFNLAGVGLAAAGPAPLDEVVAESTFAPPAPGWLACDRAGAGDEELGLTQEGEIRMPTYRAQPAFGPPAAGRMFSLCWAETEGPAPRLARREPQSLPAEPKPLVPESRLRPYRDGDGPRARAAAGTAPQVMIPHPAARQSWDFAPLWRQVSANARWVALTLPILVGLGFYLASPGAPPADRAQVTEAKPQGALARQWGEFRQVILKRAAIELSDDFRSGLADWEGAPGWSSDWSYDPAGFVRTGPLALFRPTMAMSDYRIEFLGQIEKKGLGWAFRAADLKNYYAMKLVVAKPGPVPSVAVERYAVIDGVEGPRTRTPLPLLVRQDTLYRVRVDARGSLFTIYVQGQMVTHWTDERLKSGGIGFFSAKGEQARLRWVEVQHQYDALGRLCAFLAPYGLPAREVK